MDELLRYWREKNELVVDLERRMNMQAAGHVLDEASRVDAQMLADARREAGLAYARYVDAVERLRRRGDS